jgi:hypothetical protein
MNKRAVKDKESALQYTLQRIKDFGKKHDITINIDEVDDGYHVGIPVGHLDDLFNLENELWEMGISFDTGCGFGYRDWELDWSFTYEK